MLLYLGLTIFSILFFIFAWKTRSLAGTVIIGMALFWIAGKLFQ